MGHSPPRGICHARLGIRHVGHSSGYRARRNLPCVLCTCLRFVICNTTTLWLSVLVLFIFHFLLLVIIIILNVNKKYRATHVFPVTILCTITMGEAGKLRCSWLVLEGSSHSRRRGRGGCCGCFCNGKGHSAARGGPLDPEKLGSKRARGQGVWRAGRFFRVQGSLSSFFFLFFLPSAPLFSPGHHSATARVHTYST